MSAPNVKGTQSTGLTSHGKMASLNVKGSPSEKKIINGVTYHYNEEANLPLYNPLTHERGHLGKNVSGKNVFVPAAAKGGRRSRSRSQKNRKTQKNRRS